MPKAIPSVSPAVCSTGISTVWAGSTKSTVTIGSDRWWRNQCKAAMAAAQANTGNVCPERGGLTGSILSTKNPCLVTDY
jgi:hypothetical protein